MQKHVIVTGNVVDGFYFHGPVEAGSPEVERVTRWLDDDDQEWGMAPLGTLADLVDPNGDDIAGQVDVEQVHAEQVYAAQQVLVERVGPPVYFVQHNGDGEAVSAFGIVDRELIEVSDLKPGAAPDWENGGICDEVRGEPDFFHPAVALLRFLDSTANDVPVWHYTAKRRVEAALTGFVQQGLIFGHQTHEPSGGIVVLAHNSHDEHVLRTPAQGDAFCAGLTAAAASWGVGADRR